MTVFDSYAHYYDLFYKYKDYAGEAKFVDKLLKRCMPSTCSILDFGCGTGRHAVEFVRLGYEVMGVEISSNMVSRSDPNIKKLPVEKQQNISVIQGDIRNINLERCFDSVVSLFHVMSYQVTNGDLLASFSAARNHLGQDGIFLFDCWYGPAVLADPPVLRTKQLEDDICKVLRIADPVMYPNSNLVDVNYHITVQNKVTKKSEEFTETHCMRYLFEPEIRQMLESTGFELLSSTGWMDNRDPGPDTWNVAFIARAG